MEKEYQVTIEKCEQTSPDNWAMSHYSLKVTDSTTIGEIQLWVAGLFRPHSNEIKMDFRVVELQIPSPQTNTDGTK